MKKILFLCLLSASLACFGQNTSQDYSGTWAQRYPDDVVILEDDIFIILEKNYSGNYGGKFVYLGKSYNIQGSKPYKAHSSHPYLTMNLNIYDNGRLIDKAEVHFYPLETDRLDLVFYSEKEIFPSIYNMQNRSHY